MCAKLKTLAFFNTTLIIPEQTYAKRSTGWQIESFVKFTPLGVEVELTGDPQHVYGASDELFAESPRCFFRQWGRQYCNSLLNYVISEMGESSGAVKMWWDIELVWRTAIHFQNKVFEFCSFHEILSILSVWAKMAWKRGHRYLMIASFTWDFINIGKWARNRKPLLDMNDLLEI